MAPVVRPNYPAVTGYDLCTGWGTPNGTNLINALVVTPDTLVVTPANGFVASGPAGGPFSPASQTYFLTNSGANPLTWSLVSTSAWLNASVSNGTLAAGATNSVTISLAAAANSLAVGTYAATVSFTNWNTHVVQSLLFNLASAAIAHRHTGDGFYRRRAGCRAVQPKHGKFPVDQHRQHRAELVAHQHLRLAHGLRWRHTGRWRHAPRPRSA